MEHILVGQILEALWHARHAADPQREMPGAAYLYLVCVNVAIRYFIMAAGVPDFLDPLSEAAATQALGDPAAVVVVLAAGDVETFEEVELVQPIALAQVVEEAVRARRGGHRYQVRQERHL